MNVLYVDPDDEERARVAARLDSEGFEVDERSSLENALAALDAAPVDCVVTEHDLPDGSGLELVRATREHRPDAACVLFTGVRPGAIDSAAFGELVAEYVPRDAPGAADQLVDLVEHSAALGVQTAYPLPDDERARLAALDRYADDAEALDEAFDRLAELAVDLFDVDAAVVGLLDAHHEEFRSCHGKSMDRLERESTICTYAILDDDVTVVEDVRTDPRFADNQALVEANIRFYAGVPLLTPEGHAVGTFCLHDDEPRSFDAGDRRLLSLLGEEAMEQMELRRRLRGATSGEEE